VDHLAPRLVHDPFPIRELRVHPEQHVQLLAQRRDVGADGRDVALVLNRRLIRMQNVGQLPNGLSDRDGLFMSIKDVRHCQPHITEGVGNGFGNAESLGLKPMARIVETALVGCDPVLMLEGPIPATEKLLAASGLGIDDIDVFEVNEAFASVVLSWAKTVGADLAEVNPNGGAISLGHPLGATGCFLITKAVHELQRSGGDYGLVSMCCGGGLGTGTLVQRV